MGIGLGPSCCCNNYSCFPCTCFTFYNPSTLETIESSDLGLNLSWQASYLYQCPFSSGDNTDVFYFANYQYVESHIVSGYRPGTIVCTDLHSNSKKPFNTQPGSGCFYDIILNSGFTPSTKIICDNNLAIYCGGFNTPGYNLGSGWNAPMQLYVRGFPDGFPFDDGLGPCPQMNCEISWDVCAGPSGNHDCIPVPYCPTQINLKWDALLFNLFPSYHNTQGPQPQLVTQVCPWGAFDEFQWYSCGDAGQTGINPLYPNCATVNGGCTYMVFPEVLWSSGDNRYTVFTLNKCPTTNLDVYATNLPFWPNNDSQTGYPPVYFANYVFTNAILPGLSSWDSALIVEDCLYQKIDLCNKNGIQLTATNYGQGGWVSQNWQQCEKSYCCGVTSLPAEYPQDPLNISINTQRSFSFIILGSPVTKGPYSFNFNGQVSIDYVNFPEPPGIPCQGIAGGVGYANKCFGGTTVTMPVLVNEVIQCVGQAAAGIADVELTSVCVGLPGFQPDGLYISTPGTTNFGDQCPNAILTDLLFSPWDCANGQANSWGSRDACFDSNLHFTGWADNDPCCGCDCNNDCLHGICTYYIGTVNGVSFAGSAYGTIDHCNNILMLTIYDGNGLEIGTISL